MLFAAHQPLLDRLRTAGITTAAVPIGFGADTKDFRYDGQHTVMVVLNKNAQDSTLDLARFKTMIKDAAQGRDVISDAKVNLQAPLALKAMTSVAIAW